VINSTFSHNSTLAGGAIFNSVFDGDTPSRVINSTFSHNSAPDNAGGGIFNQHGMLRVINSTFFANNALYGGGIFNEGTLRVTNSTFSANSANERRGGAIGDAGFTDSMVTLRKTIMAKSRSGGNCSGFGFIDGRFNIDSGTSCGFERANKSLPATKPLLDPAGLSDNGGPTKTIALQPDSPAVDLVGERACPPPETDQRGVDRPQGAACDSGAFERRSRP
jgi:hypothetical protein